MTTDNAWLYGVLPFVTMAVLTVGFVVVFRQRSAARRAALGTTTAPPAGPDAPGRPWWGSPLVWLAIAVVSLLLGIFVWPGLFGFTFIFVPILWWRRPRSPSLDPRSNGHSHRDASSFMPE